MENKGIVPFLNERGINQARSERVSVGNWGMLFRLLMGVSRVQARTLMLHVIRKTGTRWDNRGRGKSGAPSLMGLGGANVQ